jgi:hypothetical protein
MNGTAHILARMVYVCHACGIMHRPRRQNPNLPSLYNNPGKPPASPPQLRHRKTCPRNGLTKSRPSARAAKYSFFNRIHHRT